MHKTRTSGPKAPASGLGSFALSLAATLAVGAASCGGGPEAFHYDRHALLQDITLKVILPTYADLKQRTEELRQRAAALCEAPDTTALTSAQAAWRAARRPLKLAEPFQFGPIEDRRISAALDFWPVREDSIEGALASGTGPFTNDAIEALGAASKGLPAMEYLLFDPARGNPAVLASLSSGSAGRRRCEYLAALATNAAAKTAELYSVWDPAAGNYAAQYIEAGASSTAFVTQQAAVDRLVNQALTLTEVVADRKLGDPLGASNGGVPQPQAVESRYSDNSLEDLEANLRGIQDLYLGSTTGSVGLGLSDVVRKRDAQLDTQIRESLRLALEAEAAIPPPLSRAVTQAPATVQAAFTQTKSLQRLMKVDMADLLGVILTFDGNDGD